MASRWAKVKGWLGGEDADSSRDPATDRPDPVWRERDESPFGFPVLDLTPVTQGLTAWTGDEDNAARALSWGSSGSEGLDEQPARTAGRFPSASASCMRHRWRLSRP